MWCSVLEVRKACCVKTPVSVLWALLALVKGAELECAGTAVQAAFTEECIIEELQM